VPQNLWVSVDGQEGGASGCVTGGGVGCSCVRLPRDRKHFSRSCWRSHARLPGTGRSLRCEALMDHAAWAGRPTPCRWHTRMAHPALHGRPQLPPQRTDLRKRQRCTFLDTRDPNSRGLTPGPHVGPSSTRPSSVRRSPRRPRRWPPGTTAWPDRSVARRGLKPGCGDRRDSVIRRVSQAEIDHKRAADELSPHRKATRPVARHLG
jgi:hypothetical protein